MVSSPFELISHQSVKVKLLETTFYMNYTATIPNANDIPRHNFYMLFYIFIEENTMTNLSIDFLAKHFSIHILIYEVTARNTERVI